MKELILERLAEIQLMVCETVEGLGAAEDEYTEADKLSVRNMFAFISEKERELR